VVLQLAYKGQQAFLEKAVDKVAEAYVNTIYVNETTRSSKN